MHSVFRARVFADAVADRLMALMFAPLAASISVAWVIADALTGHSPA
jgi:hypothetical protein